MFFDAPFEPLLAGCGIDFLGEIIAYLVRVKANDRMGYSLIREVIFDWLQQRPNAVAEFAIQIATRRPIWRVSDGLLVTGHHEITQILGRDRDFQLAPLISPRTYTGDFLLSLENGPSYQKTREILIDATRNTQGFSAAIDDLCEIHVRNFSDSLFETKPKTVDVIADFCEPAVADIVAKLYFGNLDLAPQDISPSIRILANHMVGDRTNPEKTAEAARILERLVRTSAQIDSVNCHPLGILQKIYPCLEPGEAIAAVCGLATTGVTTITKAFAHCIAQLLGDEKLLKRFQELTPSDPEWNQMVLELLRFWPVFPFIRRYAPVTASVSARDGTQFRLNPGDTITLALVAGMFDPKTFPEPRRVRIDRKESDYLVFGSGLHQCFGRSIVFMVLRHFLPSVLASSGRFSLLPGRQSDIRYDGPAAIHLTLGHDP